MPARRPGDSEGAGPRRALSVSRAYLDPAPEITAFPVPAYKLFPVLTKPPFQGPFHCFRSSPSPTLSATRISPTSAPRAAAVAQALEDSRTRTLALDPSTWLRGSGAVRASPERSGTFQTRGAPATA